MSGRHLFVCTNGRSSGKPACGPRGGDALIAAVHRELLAVGATHPSPAAENPSMAAHDALVTPCACLGPCFDGPNAVIYPDGVWYAGLTADDAAGLVEHLIRGVPLDEKRAERPGPARD